jgi:hypothetical protein
MTQDEIEKSNEEQELLAAMALDKSNDVYLNLINSITEDEAEDILNVIKYGSEADILKMAKGLVDIYG